MTIENIQIVSKFEYLKLYKPVWNQSASTTVKWGIGNQGLKLLKYNKKWENQYLYLVQQVDLDFYSQPVKPQICLAKAAIQL